MVVYTAIAAVIVQSPEKTEKRLEITDAEVVLFYKSSHNVRAFYEKHRDCEVQLQTWYKEASRANWRSPKEIKKIFGSAGIMNDNRIVFNIKGNKYRLIVKFNYKYGWAWIRFIGTHQEYDRIDAETI